MFSFFKKKEKSVKDDAIEKIEKMINDSDNLNVTACGNLIMTAILSNSIEPSRALAAFENFLNTGNVPNIYF